MSEHTVGVIAHKRLVAHYMQYVASELFLRAVEHDDSKFSDEELPAFEVVTAKLKDLTYGSPEYTEAIKELGPALEHHYQWNRHHPEHFGSEGVSAMHLIDLMEMLCDWMAAVRRVKNGDIMTSLTINKERFGIDDQLAEVLENTVALFIESGL